MLQTPIFLRRKLRAVFFCPQADGENRGGSIFAPLAHDPRIIIQFLVSDSLKMNTTAFRSAPSHFAQPDMACRWTAIYGKRASQTQRTKFDPDRPVTPAF